MQRYSWPAKLFIGFVSASGLGILCYGTWTCQWGLDLRFLSLLVVAVLASRLKLRLPGMTGTMSVNLPFLLVAAAWLSLPAALMIGSASAFAQSVPAKHSPFKPIHMLFNFSVMAIAVGAGWAVLNHELILRTTELPEKVLLLIAASGAFFVAQTVPVAIILSLTERARALGMWHEIVAWSFPYYVLSAGVSLIISLADRYLSWYLPLIALPVMFAVYRSYRRYFGTAATPRVEPVIAVVKRRAASAT